MLHHHGERGRVAAHAGAQDLSLSLSPDTQHSYTRRIHVCEHAQSEVWRFVPRYRHTRVARLPRRERLVRRLRGVRRSINYLTRSSSIVSLAGTNLKRRRAVLAPEAAGHKIDQ
jgi:hypothetical protein